MKLFVIPIPYDWTKNDLIKLFESYAPAEADVFQGENEERKKGRGIIEIPDESLANRAIAEMKGFKLKIGKQKRKLNVKQWEELQSAGENPKNGPEQGHPLTEQKAPPGEMVTRFPYRFAKRESPKQKRGTPPGHHKLEEGRVDLALEVNWTTLTLTAANPCNDEGTAPCCPGNTPGEFAGYDKRWLMVDNRPAVSPFTVKSALANGFANLLGGCYRVINRTEEHKNFPPGFPYTGKYKRYRVAMGGQSKPGILRNITQTVDGRIVEIQQVEKEYYYDQDPLPFPITTPTVFALVEPRGRYKPGKIKQIAVSKESLPQGQRVVEMIYHSPYGWGMRVTAGCPKPWKHRFYTLPKGGVRLVRGLIPETHFNTLNQLEKRVFMGQDKDQTNSTYRWFQDISSLSTNDWVYYEVFDNRVTNIGRSFLFKALFQHEDTIPPGYETCINMERLCPRCAMFGMTDKRDEKDREAVGYGGRFKASALVCDQVFEEDSETIPLIVSYGEGGHANVELKKWTSDNQTRCRQFLLPIQGAPKPNKRDEDAYFNLNTGWLKGPKTHRHAAVMDFEDLEDLIRETARGDDYSHKLRNYAQVCDRGLSFTGTVGAENCTADEAAALLILLESRLAKHGFKIGGGKAFGLGSVASSISRVWFRNPETYQWESFSPETPEALIETLRDHIPDLDKNIKIFQKAEEAMNLLEGYGTRKLKFPGVGRYYWNDARNSGLNAEK